MGSSVRIVLGALVLIALGGAYNYHRNEYLDRDLESRAYRTVRDPDLVILREAYESELRALQDRYSRLGSPKGASRARSRDVKVKIGQFEAAQRHNERKKALHRQILEREIELEALRTEREIRVSGLDQEWRRVLRRLITL
ncbi:MAG: hypothetical protein V3T14_03600 [Myxococcota bacterium]